MHESSQAMCLHAGMPHVQSHACQISSIAQPIQCIFICVLIRGTICNGQPALLHACDDGLVWTVMHWATPVIWPGLGSLIQSALNTTAAKKQTEVEVLLEMGSLRNLAVKHGSVPDWQAIEEHAVSQQPACTPYIKTLAQYAREMAPELLEELSLFAKAFASNANKACGSEFFAKLNSIQWGKGIKKPFLLNAAVCANLTSPSIVNGICKLLPPAALSALTNKANKDACMHAPAC